MEHGQNYQHQRGIWDKIWKDSRGHVVIFQMPNAWLIVWAVLDIISIFTNGTFSNIFWWLASGVLAFWAILELWKGVNYFRRVLGFVILLLVILSLFKIGL